MIPDFIQRHKAGFLLFTFTTISLVFLMLQVTPFVNGVKSVGWFFISPSIVYSGHFFNKLDSIRGRLFELVRVQGENYILRDQIVRLSKSELERDTLQLENNRLRSLLAIKQQSYRDGVVAEVVSFDIRYWFQSFNINKGSVQNIKPSAAVVTASIDRPVLVGRILEVKDTSSKVLLLTDRLSAITSIVSNTGDMGLLEGTGKSLATLRYLPGTSSIGVGDEIVTAGFGGVFPSGIPIGRVLNVRTVNDGFFKEAYIVPYLKMGLAREVVVLERAEIQRCIPSF